MLDDIEQKTAALTLEEVRIELRGVIEEQHKGKWIYAGPEGDKTQEEKHNEFVRSRVRWGIALTARERGIQVEGKKGSKASRSAKESIAAAITEDLLS